MSLFKASKISTVPIRHVSMATNSDGLCSICVNVDLIEYFRREIHEERMQDFVSPGQRALRLGYLEDIEKRCESCVFCRLIIESLCKRRAPSQWLTRQGLLDHYGAEGIKYECFLFSYLYADNMRPHNMPAASLFEERDSQRAQQQAHRIGIGLRAPTVGPEVRFGPQPGVIQLSAISAAKYGMPRRFHGRVFNSERVDMDMARNWLSECETDHKELCSFPDMAIGGSASPAGPQDLLVVDVLRMNLCRMPHGSRYIALSYCWPKVNTFITTRSNVTELYNPGALRHYEERIIEAIQDAIRCVSELGERYLWVDALCIVQDDEEHKSSQIQQMDQVYGSSLLTLIHALPNARAEVETHYGLVGYRKGSRMTKQATFQVQGLELLIPSTGLDEVISSSSWITRAWTFQEERLSRRRLYFTETQMYFQCSCALFCEDSVGEGIDPSASIHPNTNLWNSSGLYRYRSVQGFHKHSATSLSRLPVDSPTAASDAYALLINEFSGRQMSDPRDIIASFEGILSVFGKSLKTDIWFGLPEKYLNEALLWIEAGPSLRRNISISPSSDMKFPTWSWAGWDTAVKLQFGYPGFILPEVEWFVISQSGEAIQLVTPGSYNLSRRRELISSIRSVRAPAGLPDDFLKTVQHRTGLSESKKRRLPRFLACWTCITLFRVADEEIDAAVGSGLPILDNAGRWAGSAFMGQGWKDNTKGNSRTCEFMLLSHSSFLYHDIELFDEVYFSPREWCILNVMLIQRDGDRAQRVGVGVIHEDAWVEANPVPMLIKLE